MISKAQAAKEKTNKLGFLGGWNGENVLKFNVVIVA